MRRAEVGLGKFLDHPQNLHFMEEAYRCNPNGMFEYQDVASILANEYERRELYSKYIELQMDLLKTRDNNAERYYNIARVFCLAGNIDSAFVYLEIAHQRGHVNLKQFQTESAFTSIRELPRFQIMQKAREDFEQNELKGKITQKISELKQVDFEKQADLRRVEELIALLEQDGDYMKCLEWSQMLYRLSPHTTRYTFFQAKYLYLLGHDKQVLALLNELTDKGFHNIERIKRTFTRFAEQPEFQNIIWKMDEVNQEFVRCREVKQYHVVDGLTHQNVWSFYLDKDSNLWIGTEVGLNKYNGHEFVTYTADDGMDFTYITAITEDNNRNLLMLTLDNGLIRFDGRHFTQYYENDGMASLGGVSNIIEDSPGNFWFGLSRFPRLNKDRGLCRFDGTDFLNLTMADGLPGNTVTAIVRLNGNLIVGTDRGLCLIEGERVSKIYTTKDGLAGDAISDMTQDQLGNLWVATNEGLCRFDGQNFSNYYMEDGLVTNIIRKVFVDNENNIWVCCGDDNEKQLRGGIIVIKGESFICEDFDIEASSPRGIIQDSFGDIWLGCYSVGVFKIKRKEFVENTKWMDYKNYRIHQDSNGNVFIITEDQSVYTYQGEKILDPPELGMIYGALFLDSKRNLWYTYQNQTGLMTDDGQQVTCYGSNDGIFGECSDLAEDNKGNLWFKTIGVGLTKFDGQHFRNYSIDDGLRSNNFFNFVFDSKDNIWLYHQNAGEWITKFDGNSFTHFSLAEIEGSFIPWHIFVDSMDNVWIGSWSNGIAKYDGHRLTHYNMNDGLGANSIGGIREDLEHNIWISPHGGLVTKFDPDNEEFINYSKKTGFDVNEYFNKVTIAPDSIIWLAYHDGKNPFMFDTRLMDKYPPTNLINQMIVNDSLVYRPGESIELKHNQNNITFDYVGINFRSEGLIVYKTWLHGYEENWSALTDKTELSYLNLLPGSYTFKIKSRNQHGYWNETPAEIRFEILPPWWTTWWAYVVYAVILIFSIFGIVRWRSAKLEMDKRILTQKVKERTEELVEAKEAAEVANIAKSAFLANMSHELRTPLNAILGFAKLLKRDPQLLSSQQENLDIIERSGHHLLGLINDVLDISKIEAGQMKLQKHEFDFPEMMAAIDRIFRLQAEQKGLDFSVQLDGNIPQLVKGDEKKIRQILINVVGNALKFTRRGAISVTICCGEINNSRLKFQFIVQDSGPGLAPDDIAKVFTAFSQAESNRQQNEGAGLGLTISREFARLMGGDIHLESIVGQGTTVSFAIEVDIADPGTLPAAVQPSRQVIELAPGQSEIRVLIVEDRWENRILLRRLLEPVGFQIREAVNGLEGVQIAREWQPHLIWMDIRMPIMDGLEATRQIKAQPGGQSIKIMALTASVFDDEIGKVQAAGCDDFVRKPFQENLIFDKMAEHLHIRYIEKTTVESALALPTAITDERSRVLHLSMKWLDELDQAVQQTDFGRIINLNKQIKTSHPEIYLTITDLVNKFEYDQIRSLIERLRLE